MTDRAERPAIHPVRTVAARLVREPWAWAEANRERIVAHWRGLVAEKPALFNGAVLLCTGHGLSDGVFRATYREADYASFIAWRDFGWPDPDVANCFAMAALRGSDGAYLLGEMAPHTSNPGLIYFAAGTPDRGDVTPDDGVDLAGSVLRELEEETGIPADAVTVEPGWTLVDDYPRLALMRELTAPMPAEALKARIEAWLSRQDLPELAAIHIARRPGDIPRERMPRFMAAFLEARLGASQPG